MENSRIVLPTAFFKWFDGKRRKYERKYPQSNYEQIIKMAYADWCDNS